MAAALQSATTTPAQLMKSRTRYHFRHAHMVVVLQLKQMTLVIVEVAPGRCLRRLPVAKRMVWCVSLPSRTSAAAT